MKRSVIFLLALAGILGCTGVEPSNINLGSKTKSMTWDVTNSVNETVDLRFFDVTTGGVWPSQTQVYTLDSGERGVWELEGNANSKICFGASRRSDYKRYGGVGADNSQSCSDCCHINDGSDPTPIRLQPR